MRDPSPSVVSLRPVPHGIPASAWLRFGLIALLFAEVLFLTISFDTQALSRAGSVWTMVAGWSPQYLRVAIAAAFALSLVALSRMGSVRWTDAATDVPASRRWLAFHLAAFAVFIWLTRRFFTGAQSSAYPGVWTVTWFLSGAAMIASWARAAFPQRRWWASAVENRALMVVSLATGTAIWAASFITETFWTPLARYTFNVVTGVLGVFYAGSVSQPDKLIVGTPRFKVLISPECSGYEGIGLILAFLTIYLFLLRRELRFPAALILLPIGAAVMWVVNVGRIVALIAIGSSGWPSIAAGGFHSQAGWIAFNAVALGFVALTSRGGWFRTRVEHRLAAAETPRGAVAAASDATTALLGPFVAMLAATMATGAISAGFDWLYGVRMVAVLAVMWACRGTYRSLDWRASWGAFAIGIATFVMWVSLFPATVHDKSNWPIALQSVGPFTAGVWLALRLVGYVLVAPVVEELAFRAYAMRRLIDSDINAVAVGRFSIPAFVISSLLFGALHGALWIQGTLAGMAFAGALCWRRRFGDAVIAHATTNALIAIYVFMTGNWSMWS